VELPELGIVETVGADQDTSGPQHSRQFGHERVLHGCGWNMVKHGERSGRAEAPGVEREMSPIGLKNGDVGSR